MKLKIALLVAVLAVACSRSHHNSTDTPSTFPAVSDGSTWGTVICKDHCGCLPPKRDRMDWQTIKADDLCGEPWACEYRCHADCAAYCEKADLDHSGRVDGYDLALARDTPAALAAVEECFGAKC